MCTYDWNIEKISCNKLLFHQCEFIPKTNVIMPIIIIPTLRIDKSPSHLQATYSVVLDQQKTFLLEPAFLAGGSCFTTPPVKTIGSLMQASQIIWILAFDVYKSQAKHVKI